MTRHVPKPPLRDLTGRWIVERAEAGPVEEIRLGNRTVKPMRTWGLTLRHVDTGTTAVVQARAIPRTEYRAGQEVNGYVAETWDGDFFRRDRPTVGPERA